MSHRMHIFFVFILIFCKGLAHGASINVEEIVGGWNDEKKMRGCYRAMVRIRQAFEAFPIGERSFGPISSFYYRSPYYMYLEIIESKKAGATSETQELARFYTPFGELYIFGDIPESNKPQISKNILKKMEQRWSLEEVTERIHCSSLDFISGPDVSIGEHCPLSEPRGRPGYRSRLFLIKSIDEIVFAQDPSELLVVFTNVFLGNRAQYHKDKALFAKILASEQQSCIFRWN